MNIEKNIPIPLATYAEVAKKMDFGDSVLFAGMQEANELRQAIQKQGSIAIWRAPPNGIRVWKQKPQTEKES